MNKLIKIELTPEELLLVVEALDSHAYWQLSDEHYRRDGFVDEPGSDDPENAAQIVATNALHDQLEKLIVSSQSWGYMLDRWHDEKGPAHLLKPDGSPSCGASYHVSAGQAADDPNWKCKRCLRIGNAKPKNIAKFARRVGR